MASKCKDCGCVCKKCTSADHDVHLHVEIENLKQKLVERENQIVTMETNFLNETNKYPNGEMGALREELLTWQDKYRRLYDAHRRVQRVNQGLEDKLLKLVDTSETDKNTLTKDVAALSHKLAEANYIIKKLTKDNERYKSDVTLAIQFLQCKQSNFVAHKFDTLPQEVQDQVSSFMTNKKKPEEKKVSYEMKSIKVPIPTFPPTAMVYSIPKSPRPTRNEDKEPEAPTVDIVSAAIMAKILEERQKERAFAKHCDTCSCSNKLRIVYDMSSHSVGTQTSSLNSEPAMMRGNLLCAFCSHDIVEKTGEFPNIVKVQPNNFLVNNHPHQSESCTSADQSSSKNDSSCSNLLNVDMKSSPDVNFFSVNANRASTKKSLRLGVKVTPPQHYCTRQLHHHQNCGLFDMQKSGNKTDCEYCDESKVAKYCSEIFKAPPQQHSSSMRLLPARNILLDGAALNTAPTHKPKVEEHAKTDKSSSSAAFRQISDSNNHIHQQRVAEWIDRNLEETSCEIVSSPDNSQAESLEVTNSSKVGFEQQAKYAEMEENVKRFLFGESDFLKTVEIGKLKYQIYREQDSSLNADTSATDRTRSNSHTETEI